MLDGDRTARHAAARRPASSPRRPGGLDRSYTTPPTSQTPPPLPSSSPSLSPRHGRHRHARTVVEAAPTVVPEPRLGVRRLRRPRLLRTGRAPSARPALETPPTSSSPTPAAEIPLAVPLSSDHPRARSGACCNPCEPSFVLPLSVGSLLPWNAPHEAHLHAPPPCSPPMMLR